MDLMEVEFQAGWWVMLRARVFGKRVILHGQTSGGTAVAYIWRGRYYVAKIIDEAAA